MNPHNEGTSVLAKNSIFNFLGQVLPIPVGILTIPYIVKGLGADGYGILSIAWMVLGYFSIFDLGLSRATVKFVAENLSPEKIHKIPELVWTSLTLLVGLGTLGGLLVAAFVPVAVTHFFKMPAAFIPEAKLSLLLLALSMPVMLGNDALRGVLEASQRFDLVNYVKVPASVAFYLVAALVIPFGVHVSRIVFLLVMIRFTTACIYLLLCLHVFPGLKSGYQFSRNAMRPLTIFGGWIMVSNITGPIAGYLERFLIASVLSVGMLTFYSAPYDMVSKVVIFPASIVPTLFPYFSFHGGGKGSLVSDVTARTLQWLIFLMTPAVAVFGFFAHPILQLWLGAQFADTSTSVLQILALLCFINSFAYVPYTSVQALGRPDLKAILDLVVLPIFAISAWFGMKLWGINGAALAKLLITVIDCGCLFWFASRMNAFSLKDLIAGPVRRAVYTALGLVVAFALIARAHWNLIPTAISVFICLACYPLAIWTLALDADDKGAILNLTHSMTGNRFVGLIPESEVLNPVGTIVGTVEPEPVGASSSKEAADPDRIYAGKP